MKTTAGGLLAMLAALGMAANEASAQMGPPNGGRGPATASPPAVEQVAPPPPPAGAPVGPPGAVLAGPPGGMLAGPEFYLGSPGPDPWAEPDCGVCTDCQLTDCHCDAGRFVAGYAFVFVKPHFEDNPALFTITTDDATFSDRRETSFGNELEVSPRVWLEYSNPNGLGARATYWEFDHNAPTRRATPADNGFQTIAPVTFGAVDLSTSITGQTLAVESDLEVDTVDLEGTAWTRFGCWSLLASGGFRYAAVAQEYRVELRDVDGEAIARLQRGHRFDGFGPTVAFEARRPMGCLTVFGLTRGSLAFGNGKASLLAGEDLDLDVPFITTASSRRNDVLPIAELQIGVEWTKHCCNGGRFFCRTALEGQVWQGAGNATSEEGDLGFFGFNVALGLSL